MSLSRYISEFITKDGEATHGSLSPTGRYNIDLENLKQFTMYYMQALHSGERLSITELQTFDFIPLILDIDLSIPLDDNYDNDDGYPSLYHHEHVKNIYNGLVYTMKNLLIPDLEKDNMKCFLMERDGYESVKKNGQRMWKNGFHLHFPYLMLNRNHIKKYFLPFFVNWIKETNIEIPDMVSYDNLIDDSIYSGKGKPWFMYGSTKPLKDLNPYLVSGVFYENSEKEIVYSDDWLPHLLNYRLVYTKHDGDIEKLNRNCLPEIFSIRKDDNHDMYIFEINDSVVEFVEEEEPKIHKLVENTPCHAPISTEFFDQLLECLPLQYAEEYDKWKQIGWVIYNHFDGSLDGFQRFDAFSKLCIEKYKYEDCMKEWNMMTRSENEVGIGTLRYLVRKHNPVEYNTICKKHIDSKIEDTLYKPTSHYDLAKILFEEFRDTYVCSSIKHNEWYMFDGTIWTRIDDGVCLRKEISTFLVSKYERVLHSLLDDEKNSLDEKIHKIEKDIENEMCNINQYQQLYLSVSMKEKPGLEKSINSINNKIEKLNEKLFGLKNKRKNPGNKQDNRKTKKGENDDLIEKLYKIIASLKSSPFKKNIMIEAKDIFYNRQFYQKLNQSIYKIAFANGIYDLEKKIFREGLPTDYISLKMNINFRQDFTNDCPEVKQIDCFFEKVFPDEHLRRYFLGLQSENFVGRNIRKIFQMWVGTGDNSKSLTQSMFESLLGPYCQKLPTSLLTQKRSASSSASPELVRAGEGCRLCFFQEPNKTDKFNIGLLKELTGNDRFFARPLFREPIDITPQFKLVCIANHPPIVENSQNDKAIYNRVRIIPFQSYFPINDAEVPESEEEQKRQKIFYRDSDLTEKIPSMLEALAYRLVNIYINGENKVTEPLCVMQATENYHNKCNRILCFIQDEIDEEKPGSKLSLKLFCDRFSDYCKIDLNGVRPTNRIEIGEYLDNRWGVRDENQCYENVGFKNNN